MAVMLSLAYSVQKMLEEQNFVKRLTSCEIMGGANNICSDKTGTLTQNKMTWIKIILGGQVKDCQEVKSFKDLGANDKVEQIAKEAGSCNTIGSLTDADATELAVLKMMNQIGADFDKMRKELHPKKDLIRFPFDSTRKRMTTFVEYTSNPPTETGFHRRMHTKGAAEKILETCSHYLDLEGNKVPIDDAAKNKFLGSIDELAVQALRAIAFAYKDVSEGQDGKEHKDIEKGSKIYNVEMSGNTLICIAGIKDIIRPEVPDAVKKCKKAGVRVRMVTGDQIKTAIAIAKECGIINKDGSEDNIENVCMEGPAFDKYVKSLVHYKTGEPIEIFGKDPDVEVVGDLENMKKIRDNLKVLARSRPADKYVMVAGLKQLGDIVAVTGDGTNDAPALKKANVGFAMKTGTQVAAAASDIIIQDDNFASIVSACKWGRNVYDNIRRFL